MAFKTVVFLTLLLTSLAGCASFQKTTPETDRYQLDRLYFGRAIADTGIVSDSAWTVFVHDVVTPRFPAGITTWRAEGQWRSSTGAVVREPTVVLEIVHSRSQEAETSLRTLILEYKQRFLQESVLRVTTEVRAQF